MIENINFRRWILMMIMADMSIALQRLSLRSHTPRPRVVEGWDDHENKYPFVVALLMGFSLKISNIQPIQQTLYLRSCTGSIITKQFVLTAAHCLHPLLHFVRWGDMSVSLSEAKTISQILKQIGHPAFLVPYNDVALIMVQELSMESYGRLHSADYKILRGRSAQYAGYGMTTRTNNIQSSFALQNKSLQIGEGVIFDVDEKRLGQPQLLVAPKCNKKKQHVYSGDSGGPLFVGGKIVGVACAVPKLVVKNIDRHPAYAGFTPISPYLNWIKQTIIDHES